MARKCDVVRNFNLAAQRVEQGWSKTGRGNDVLVAICPNYTPSQLKAVDVFGTLIENEYGVRSIAAWNDSQRDRRKVARALRRAARKVSEGTLSV